LDEHAFLPHQGTPPEVRPDDVDAIDTHLAHWYVRLSTKDPFFNTTKRPRVLTCCTFIFVLTAGRPRSPPRDALHS
jgi:hypothetical protein